MNMTLLLFFPFRNLFGSVSNSVDVELVPSESIDSLDTENISLTPNKESRRVSIFFNLDSKDKNVYNSYW